MGTAIVFCFPLLQTPLLMLQNEPFQPQTCNAAQGNPEPHGAPSDLMAKEGRPYMMLSSLGHISALSFIFWLPLRWARSSQRGRCRRGRSEIPHFSSKLQLFALVLEKSGRKAKKSGKKGKNPSNLIYTNPLKNPPIDGRKRVLKSETRVSKRAF